MSSSENSNMMQNVGNYMKKKASIQSHQEETTTKNPFKFAIRTTKDRYFVNKTSTASLINDLMHLHKRIEKADCVFESGESGQLIRIHSSILMARSNWFNCAYKTFISGNKQHLNCFDVAKQDDYFNKIAVTAIYHGQDQFHFQTENISVANFKQLSNFIYTSDCNIGNENLIELLQIANLFEVNSLKDFLVSFIIERINELDMPKLVKLLYLSDMLNNDNLTNTCIQRVNSCDKQIINTNEWKRLLSIKPALVLRVFKLRNA